MIGRVCRLANHVLIIGVDLYKHYVFLVQVLDYHTSIDQIVVRVKVEVDVL